jgi:hypothetical protein
MKLLLKRYGMKFMDSQWKCPMSKQGALMKYRWAIAIVLVSIIFLGAAAVQNKGAAQITIEAGERGAVPFPHHLHQDKLEDCNICHSYFPQEPRAIEQLKEDGKLARKQVMNKLCVKCHKAEKRAGNKAGPVTCSKCHHKG